MDKNPPNMSEQEDFLSTVYNRSLKADDDNVALAAELARLHNTDAIDLVTEFMKLRNDPSTNSNFFLTEQVFERALPQINASVLAVMQCVRHLYREAGRDGTAGNIIDAFRSFCEQETGRPEEAIGIVDDDTEFVDLFGAALIAGLNSDAQHYANEAIRYSTSSDPEIASHALFALGRVQWASHPMLLGSVLEGLENVVRQRANDALLAEALSTALTLVKADQSLEDRVNKLIKSALTNGGDQVTRAASWLLSLDVLGIPDELFDILIHHVMQAAPLDATVMNNLDRCIAKLLKSGAQDRAIALAEDLLLSGPQRVDVKSLDSFARAVRKEPALMNSLATRWLLQGEHTLCEAVSWIVGAGQGANLKLAVDEDAMANAKAVAAEFLARKAIGFLFFNPISAASLIISLMQRAPDEDMLARLGNLLFDPLLLNWTGTAHDYVRQSAEKESGKTKRALERVLALVDQYIEDLGAIGNLAEFYPSTAHREAYHRKHSREMTEAFKKAEGQSALLSIIPKRVLLYGRTSIDYIHGPDGQSQRTEFPLSSHTVQMEVPRLQQIDPFGLDYTLRVFMSERMRS